MSRNLFSTIALIVLAAVTCRADITIRYTIDFKVGDAAPAAVATQMKTQMAAQIPKEQVLKIKGTKTLSTIGAIQGIVDSAAGTITLLDPATQQYASMSMPDYLGTIRSSISIPAAAQQALQSMKFDVRSSDTGQTGMVGGVRATEHLLTMSVTMNLPGANAPSGPMMRVDIRTWVASQDDLGRIPLLREYAASVQSAMRVFNPGR
jgi:hypothetical protein